MTQSSVFTALNDYFDQIYVITLDGCIDRQQSIKQNFAGLNYCFWPGTDKRKLSEDVMQDPTLYDDAMHKKTKRTTRSLVLGEYACSCSHRSIYQDMLDKRYNNALIFEDDAIPVESRLADFAQEMGTIGNQWDVILFDYYDAHFPSFKTSIKQIIYRFYQKLHIANWHKVSTNLLESMPMRDFNEYFYLLGRSSGAHAYAVSQKAAQHYVDYQTPVMMHADRIFYYYQEDPKLKEFAIKTPMFDRGEVSEISTIGVHPPKRKK